MTNNNGVAPWPLSMIAILLTCLLLWGVYTFRPHHPTALSSPACTCAGRPEGCVTVTYHADQLWDGGQAYCALWRSPKGTNQMACCIVTPEISSPQVRDALL